MTERFYVPGRLDPTRSVLGRLICRPGKDRLRAENLLYLAAVGAVVVYLMIMFVAWAWLNRSGVPTEAAAQAFWTFQAVALIGVLALAWAGYRPAVRIDVTDRGIRLRDGRVQHWIPAESLVSVGRIPSLSYHQHYRRFAKTHSFVTTPFVTVVLVKTRNRPWVLGVQPAEQNLVVDCVSRLISSPAREESRVA